MELNEFRDNMLALIQHDADHGLGSTRKNAANAIESMEINGSCSHDEAASWRERLLTPIGELRGFGPDDDFWSGLFRAPDFVDYVRSMVAAHKVAERHRDALAALAKS